MNYKNIAAILCLGTLAILPSRAAVVDSLEVAKAAATSPAALLQGKVAGVRVSSYDGNKNSALNVNIRGVNTLRSDSQPLYVVDGVVLNSSLSLNRTAFWQDSYAGKSYTSVLDNLAFVPIYDIESIEVLKDVSATAIYGAQGANGVVIITTRKSRTEKSEFKWNSDVTVDVPAVGDVFRPAVSQNHYLSLGSNVKNTVYTLSGNIRMSNGVMPGNDATYGSVKAGFDTRANSVVWFGLHTIASLGRIANSSGTAWLGSPSAMLSARGINMSASDSYSGWTEDYDDDTEDYRTATGMYLTLNFTPWLKLNNTLGVDFQSNRRYIWYGNGTSFGLEKNGAAGLISSTVLNYNAASELSFNRFIADSHKVEAKAGAELTGNWNQFNTMNQIDFFSHIMRARGLGIGGGKADIHRFNRKYSHIGVYGAASYKYKEIAGVNGTFRADATPRYYTIAEPELYYSAEAFVNVAPGVKLHAGYGRSGREQMVPYELFGNYTSGEFTSVDAGAQPYFEGLNKIASNEFNAAVDFNLLSGRIYGSLGYYAKTTADDLLLYSFGEKKPTSRFWNIAPKSLDSEISTTIANRGYEFTLGGKILDGSMVKWDLSVNGAINVNQLMAIDNSDYYCTAVGSGLTTNVNILGKPMASFYGFATDDSGTPIDQNGNGTITEADKVIIGNPIPLFVGGVNTTLSVQRFALDAHMDITAGQDLLNLNKLVESGAPYMVTDKLIENGSYARLSYLGLSYDIPVDRIKWIGSMKVKAAATNLFTLSSYSGWNPDVNSFGISSLTNGLDYGSYPLVRSVVLGLSVNF